MQTARASRPPAEGGFVMIEVLVSALVILIVAGAVLSLMTATTRSAADQRQKATAYSVAQEDQSRLRAMRLSSLNWLNQTTPVTLDGTQYTVNSTGKFVNNSTGADSSCEAENSATDYVRITSKVSWENGRKSVTLNSIVAPSNGSLDPNRGTLLVTATTGSGQKLSGLSLKGTGAGTFSGSTDANGCANFSDLPAGNYTLTAEAPGFVDFDGKSSPWTKTVGVVSAGKVPVSVTYDRPGTVNATFKYRVGSSNEFRTAYADSVVVYNALMTSGAKSFGTPGGTRTSTVTATPLFPFKEADTVYAGSCESNLPTEAAARATVIVPANETVAAPVIQLPALNLKVMNGSSAFSGARITVTDENCGSVKRVYTSNQEGAMSLTGGTSPAEPGLPWSKYKICVQGTISSENRRLQYSGISVKNLASGTPLEANLLNGSGLEKGSTRTCP